MRPVQGEDGATLPASEAVQHVDFAAQIAPLLQRSCLACHNKTDASGDLVLETADAILAGGASGPALDLQSPEKSLLLLLASGLQEPVMPPDDDRVKAPRLTPEEILLIKTWIAQGAKGSTAVGKSRVFQAPASRLKAVHAVALSSSGQVAACGRSNRLFLYHPAAGSSFQELVDDTLIAKRPGPPAAQLDDVQALAFSPDEHVLVSGGYREVKFWRNGLATCRSSHAGLQEYQIFQLGGAQGNKLLCKHNATGAVHIADITSQAPPSAVPDAPSDVQFAGWLPGSDRFALYSPAQGLQIRDGGASGYAVHMQQPAVNFAVRHFQTGGKQPWLALVAEDGQAEIVTLGDSLVSKKLNLGTGIRSVSRHDDDLLLLDGAGAVRVWPFNADAPRLSLAHGAPIKLALGFAEGWGTVADSNEIKFWSADGRLLSTYNTDFAKQRDLERRQRVEALTANTTSFRKTRGEAAEAERAKAEKGVADRETAATEAVKQRDALAMTRNAELEKLASAKGALQAIEAAENKTEEQLKLARDAVAALEASVKPLEEQLAAGETAVKKSAADLDTAKGDLDRAVRLKEAAQADLAEAEANQKRAADERAAFEALPRTAAEVIAIVHAGNWILSIHTSGQVQGYPVPAILHPEMWPLPPLEMQLDHASGGIEIVASNVARRKEDGVCIDLSTCTIPPAWHWSSTLGAEQESPFADRVTALAFSSDGQLLAAGSGEPSRGGQILLIQVETGKVLREIPSPHSDMVLSLAFSSDGAYLASSSADRLVKVWDVAKGTLVKNFEGHTHHVPAVCWQADRLRLVSGSSDTTMKIWDLLAGQQERTIGGFSKEISSIHCQGRTEQLLVTSGDASARAYRTGDGGHLRNFETTGAFLHAGSVNWDGKLFAAGAEDGAMLLWNAESGAVVSKLPAE